MSTYTDETFVRVRPFARRDEGEMTTIGDLQRQVFISIPSEGLVILDSLAEGQSVAEARQRYQSRYGEVPDMEDFLEALGSAGFVEAAAPSSSSSSSPSSRAAAAAASVVDVAGHLAWITPSRARRICRPAVLLAGLSVVAAALALAASDPHLLPGSSVLVVRRDLSVVSLASFAFVLLGVAVHEVAHLVVARAAGVPARFGVSHRLWVVVAETDMTGIWMASKRARYAAFLAGPLVDAVSASLIVGVLWAQAQGWLGLTPFEVQMVGLGLMLYLLRLAWQCFVFVRTDFYYVAVTAFNCKNLLVDTQDFLNNCVAKVVSGWRTVDQSAVPAAELRAVRWYSILWLAGRAAAFAVLFLVTLPVFWQYGVAMVPLFLGQRSQFGVLDVLVPAVLVMGGNAAGLVMWGRSLIRRSIERKSNAMA